MLLQYDVIQTYNLTPLFPFQVFFLFTVALVNCAPQLETMPGADVLGGSGGPVPSHMASSYSGAMAKAHRDTAAAIRRQAAAAIQYQAASVANVGAVLDSNLDAMAKIGYPGSYKMPPVPEM